MSTRAPGDDVLRMGEVVLRPGDPIDRFTYVKPIGRGGMAHVVLAEESSGEQRALKILKGARLKTGLARFKREFRALSRIHHPNVIRVHGWGAYEGHPFIALEYVEGIDLHRTIREFKQHGDDHRFRRSEELLVDLCRALAHVHQRGLVHRDLKPSNILVTTSGQAKLTDFGIVKDLDRDGDPFQTTTLVGTWAYASPEQITGTPLDQRSDLYSLGVILFAMLTGRRPFAADDMAGYREAHLSQLPDDPREFKPSCPAHLADICLKLLHKSPRDRFQSAREILYRLEQLDPDRLQGDGEVWQAPLVGRDAQLGTILDTLGALVRGKGGLLAVEGQAGTGRTRLLRLVERRAAILGIPVHRLDGSGGGLPRLTALARSLRASLGAEAPALLVAALSAFRMAQAEGDLVYQLVDGVREALRLQHDDGPVVLVCDDLDRVSPRERDLLAMLGRGLWREGRPLLVAVSALGDAPTDSVDAVLLGEGVGIKPIRVQSLAFSRSDAQDLLIRLLGPTEAAGVLAERLFLVTEGNPLFFAEFLSGLMQRGVLVPGRDAMELTADEHELATGHLDIPASVRAVVGARLDDLEIGHKELLQWLAVSGRPLDLDLLLDLLDAPDEDLVLDRLDELIDRGLVKERRTGTQVFHQTDHRILAGIVYRELSTERRSWLHRQLAEALEQGAPQTDDEVIGHHFQLAGQAGRAYTYLAKAATRMLARSLPAEAWELSTRAVNLEEVARVDLDRPTADAVRIELLQVRADVHYGRGEWSDCLRCLEALAKQAELAEDHAALVRALAMQGTALRRAGDARDPVEPVKAALDLARRTHDREGVLEALYSLAALAWEAGDLDRCEQLAQEGLVLVEEGPHRLRGELLLALTAVQATRGHVATAARGLDEAVEIFRALSRKRTLCVALTNLAELLVAQGKLSDARSRVYEAAELALEMGYRLGQATATRVLGEILLELNALDASEEALREALDIAGELQVIPELVAIRYALARLEARRGRPTEAERQVAVARVLAKKGDPERYATALVALNAWACAHTGDRSDALRLLAGAERELESLPVPRRCQVMLGAAKAYVAVGRNEDAERLARSAAALASSRGFRLWGLDARRLLASLVDDEAAARSWASEADALAAELEADLDPDLARAFRAGRLA